MAIFALIASSLMAWWVYVNHLTVVLADQASHLVFSRLLTDSITPGITQLGTWPPLLHVLMLPASAVDLLFRSGLAGAVTLIPIFVVGVIFLYRLTVRLTKSKFLASVSGLMYIFNPYILYYVVTPMMEVLFITAVIATAYFFLLWLETSHFKHLLLAGVFIALASVSRYEGLFLIPVAISIVVVKLISLKKSFNEIEATVIVFGIPSVLGLGYLLVYDWAFAGHPLAFIGIGGEAWFVGGDSALSLTKGDFSNSLQYILHASHYMFGKVLVTLSFPSMILLAAFSKERFKNGSVILLLLVPFIAVFLALYRGSNSIHVPELLPFGHFHNDRYAITWIGALILSPILLVTIFKNTRRRIFYTILVAMWNLFLISLSWSHFYDEVVKKNLWVVKNNISFNKGGEQSNIIRAIRYEYDFGKILAVRFNNDFLYINSSLPLSTFIYEGNFRYFSQTLERPWLYARWVIMQRLNSSSGAFRDPVKDKWANNPEFEQYYSVIGEEKDRILYKINENAVIDYVNSYHINLNKIPSLNPNIETWDPDTIWQEMQLR